MIDRNMLTEQGKFTVGANYWASHAGTAMWSDWRPDIIDHDFELLAGSGLHLLRVFPLWPVFQPISRLYKYLGNLVEYRFGEDCLPDGAAGCAGVSQEAIEHFEEFTQLAQKHGLQLEVSLITGWMSGRLFVPPALEGRNLITDPVALMWQVRFVKYFVEYFADCPSIVAWCLGNECNCMSEAPGRESAWMWTSTITNAIKSVDDNRPIVSGMHSLSIDGLWTMSDQGELTDLLTTHPYPVFTQYCDQDPINTMRSCLHATAESRLYSDISEKPCMVEEMGTLGSVIASDKITADYIRVNLYSLWANDCHGLLWWCAYDQNNLAHAPYDWLACERELGLLRSDSTPKPVLTEITKFRSFLDNLPFDTLPCRLIEAVCILSHDQNHWGAAYSSFILSKMAGFDITFQSAEQPIKEAPLYLLPCVSQQRVMDKSKWNELLKYIEAGATLYISYNNAFITEFEEITGLEIQTRRRRTEPVNVSLDEQTLKINAPYKLELHATRAKVIAAEPDANPVFTCASYGKGKVYFLAMPMETELASTVDAFCNENTDACIDIYRYISRDAVAKRAVKNSTPEIGITEHPLADNERIIVMINYSPQTIESVSTLTGKWRWSEQINGESPVCDGQELKFTIAGNDAIVFKIVR